MFAIIPIRQLYSNGEIMLVEVDIPIPSGYELSEKSPRKPHAGETVLNIYGGLPFGANESHTTTLYWILRKAWTYPMWLGGYEVFFYEGTWFCRDDPTVSGSPNLFRLDTYRFPLWIEPPDRTKTYSNPKLKDGSC